MHDEGRLFFGQSEPAGHQKNASLSERQVQDADEQFQITWLCTAKSGQLCG